MNNCKNCNYDPNVCISICSQPDSFTVQITQNEHVVYDTELLIRYNPHIGIFSYPEMNPVNVVFDQTFTKFKRKLSKENCTVQDSHLPMNIKDSTKSKPAKEVLIYYVQSCAEQHLCEIVGTINEEQLQNINKCHICHKYRCDKDNIIYPNNLKVDLNINVPVDILLKIAINYIKQNGISIIDIPNLEETYYPSLILGITTPCYLKTNNGTLRDLSNLKRTEDTVISNVGRTQSIQAGFGLSMAKFKCNYELTTGIIPFSGNIFGTVDGLSMAAKLIIDYDKACNVNLEYIKVKIGQIALEMTGLGLLNGLIINQLTWSINNELHKIIEDIIRNFVEEQIRIHL